MTSHVPTFAPRTLTLIWVEGQPLELVYSGDWDSWEAEAALEEAMRIVAYTEDEDVTNGKED